MLEPRDQSITECYDGYEEGQKDEKKEREKDRGNRKRKSGVVTLNRVPHCCSQQIFYGATAIICGIFQRLIISH